MWPRALEGCGLDFVFIDTEHIALDRGQVSWMCQAYSRMGLSPIVRIPSPDPFEATKMLDGGAAGIIAPYIETAAQSQALRGAVKWRPLKGRRLEERLAGGPFEPELEAYVRGRNEQALILNIESVPAMEALEQIFGGAGFGRGAHRTARPVMQPGRSRAIHASEISRGGADDIRQGACGGNRRGDSLLG